MGQGTPQTADKEAQNAWEGQGGGACHCCDRLCPTHFASQAATPSQQAHRGDNGPDSAFPSDGKFREGSWGQDR